MQNLKKKWLVVWKMTWRVCQIFTGAHENLKIGEICLMEVNIDTKSEGKLTFVSKNDMRNLANFHQSTCKSQNGDFHDDDDDDDDELSLWYGWPMKGIQHYSSRDYCQRSSPSRISDTQWAGFEPAQNLSSDFVEWSFAVVITTTLWHHIVSFCPKLKMHELKMNREVMCHTNKEWCKI